MEKYMNDKSDRIFIGGNPNPLKYGWSLRACNGKEPDQKQITLAATILSRQPFVKDQEDYECEIIAAAVHPDQTRIVYIESRSKNIGQGGVDIGIKIHYIDRDGRDNSVDIESYNPFFGCDVGLIEWFDDQVAILVYREKHSTYVYRIGDTWPPAYRLIGDSWQIKDRILSYFCRESENVQRLSIPSFSLMSEISVEEAEEVGQLPLDPYGF